ncbi:MAG: cation:proton antiporter [Rhodobacteraceae bacterium]|nr:cation:proton antiporter [Paracoccaceae bacterium]
MDIVAIVAFVATLFLLIGCAEPLAARLRLPYSAILAVIGTLIGAGAAFFLHTGITDALNPVAEAITALPIRSNVFLYVLLPTLLFQVTLGMNLRRMLDDWVPILVMAVVAVVVATFAVGYALWFAGALPLLACLLIGSIVSTTDPSAVVSIFRSLAAPRRLARIIEGESLLNDAAAIALFGLFMGFVMAGVPNPKISETFLTFPVLILGGAAVGWVLAQLAVRLMSWFSAHERAQMAVSVALPYFAYLAAERSIGASGVIAVVVAGLTLNLAGPGRIAPAAWANLREVWDLLAHWAGAMIFILAALLIPRLLESVTPSDVGLIAIVVLAAMAARAVILFGLLPLLTLMRLSPPVERRYRAAILWGGLRGAVTLALALAVTESFRVPTDVKRMVGILATGFTLWTLIVQGTTLRWVIRLLGLDRLSPIDAALSNQVVAVALQEVREDVARTVENYDLTHETVRAEAKRFGERLDDAVVAAEKSESILDRDRVTLGLIALAGAERNLIVDRLRERALSSRLADAMLTDADRLVEGARQGGRFGYQRAGRRSLRFGPQMRVAVFLHNRLRISGPLARLTAARFDLMLSRRLILRDLPDFVERRIRRIHGRRVADLLNDLLERRLEEVEQTLDGLRLQYPGYAEALERRFIRRTALRLEEGEYQTLLADGLIGAELYTALMQDLGSRRAAAEKRPRLDLAVGKKEFVRQFPFFGDLDEGAVRRLQRALVTRHVNAGEIIMRRDEPGRSVFFIASGAVEIEIAGQTELLGRGEIFGLMGVLLRGPRRAMVKAIAPSTLLVLDENRFRRVLRKSAGLREAVRKSALKRGLDEAQLAELGLADETGDGAPGKEAKPTETAEAARADPGPERSGDKAA